MKYRKDRYGNSISILGYGCMRFSRKSGSIDYDKTETEILKAFEGGVNYFDTAYIYPGSEVCLGNIVKKNNIRSKINIATKLPQYMVRNISQVEKIFKEELARLQTDYIDYYLMHMMTDIANWENLKKIGIEDWIADKKKSGQIRQVGFSFHGDSSMFLEILNAYDWDFCQIQYNYLDEHTQAGRKGLEAAEKKGIPVIIMEPLRGGKLVNSIPSDVLEKMKQNPRHWSAAQWAFNWLWNQSGVTCVLSGMNSVDMVEENIKSASGADCGLLTAEDNVFYEELKASILKTQKVGCTGCSYCMPCPHGVDIPETFACYNMMYANKKRTGRIYYMQTVGLRRNPGFASRCIKCGKCELHCPQKIQIRTELENADRELRPFFYRLAGSVARMFMRLNGR